MFSASDAPAIEVDIITQPASSSSSSSSSSDESDGSESTADSGAEEAEGNRSIGGKMSETAEDALNDDNFKLGMGDFVFYGLLVGRSAVSGSLLATSGCVCGIIYGLVITLVFLSSGQLFSSFSGLIRLISDERTTPALPLSIFMGMLFQLSCHQVEPILEKATGHLFDVPLYLSA